MKRNILVFGGNSFVAKGFIEEFGQEYNIYPIYRIPTENALSFDFNDTSTIEAFAEQINFDIYAILFLQGLNPSQGVKDISEEHFIKMLKINLVTPLLIVRALSEKLIGNSLIILFSSIAKRKGSYDPSYASAKAGIVGLMHSMANAFPDKRFNIISLGLVEGSPVYNHMTEDFRQKHSSRMQNNSFIKRQNINSVIHMLINNDNINRTDIAIDGGYQ